MSALALGPATRPATPPRPRRWLDRLGGAVVGLVLGVGLLAAFLTLAGGRPAAAATGTTGDPSAAWDSRVTLTDAFLTAQAKSQNGGTVHDPRLHVAADGTLTLDGAMSLFGRSLPLHVVLRPAVADGAVTTTLESAQVGGLPLPANLAQSFMSAGAPSLQPPSSAVPAKVVRLETSDGQLTLYTALR